MKAKEKAPSSPLEQLLGGKKEPEKKKAKHKKTVVTHHGNGSHTVQHSPDSPEEVSYAAADLDALHDGMEEHLGSPNHDEEGVK